MTIHRLCMFSGQLGEEMAEQIDQQDEKLFGSSVKELISHGLNELVQQKHVCFCQFKSTLK